MDEPKMRKQKNHKDKKTKELNGKYSSKYIRLIEQRQSKTNILQTFV